MKFQLTVIKYPSGRFGFVGSGIPVKLAWEAKDGGAIDPEQIEIAIQCGPGFAKKIKTRSFASVEEAVKAAAEFGLVPAVPIKK